MPVLLTLLAMTAPRDLGWTVVQTELTARFRGISAVDARTAWVSGEKGTVAKTTDGKKWIACPVKQAPNSDFRSIVAWDAETAVVLAIGEGKDSEVYRTENGGKTWDRTFHNQDPRAFYDAIAFWDRLHGIAFGDPIDGKFQILTTADGGRTWRKQPTDRMPDALLGEAAFAASGRCLIVRGSKEAFIGTGGGAARVFHTKDGGRSWKVAPTALAAGSGSNGIFGLLAVGKRVLAVGGDYEQEDQPGGLASSTDTKIWPTWPGWQPPGLREAAAKLPKGWLLVGPSGTDFSGDEGKTWTTVPSPGALHTAASAGGVTWGAGEGGLIARWSD